MEIFSKKKNLLGLLYTKKSFNFSENLFESFWVKKFLTNLSKKGKKEKIEKFFYKFFKNIKKLKYSPIFLFFESLESSKCLIKLRKVRRGREVYTVPFFLPIDVQYLVGLKLIKDEILNQKQFSLDSSIAYEFMNIVIFKKSNILLKNKKIYKKAAENKAYLHYRWY